MDSADPSDGPDRDWTRLGLVFACLVVTVAVAALMPTFATDGLAGSPIERALPGEAASSDVAGQGGPGGGNGLGALNPGETTGVGGDVGLDGDTYASTDTEIHFTVESTQGTYWRTGAYDTYSGSGWERSGETVALDGPIEHEGVRDERIEYELEFERAATAVPTAWRPNVVQGVDGLQVTEAGAVRSTRTIEPGTTVTGVSYAPERDIGMLQSKSTPDVDEQYTQLPEDTPTRLHVFTEELTAEDEGPYEKAVTIEDWLEATKRYDLGASVEDDNIADTFIFEMGGGYCEYFATAMVTMLRSQDVPARYVVGYSTGQEVEQDTYEVRAMNAHAWVEVYFEDVGWVRFDPTPASDRLAAQEEALEEIGETAELEEPGSPGDDLESPEEDQDTTERGTEISLNQTAVPGEPVEVTVTWHGNPRPETTVWFNGKPVGETDEDGTVVAVVPDVDELRITVEDVRIEPAESPEPVEETVAEPPTVAAGASSSMAEPFPQGQDEEMVEETYPVERNATVAVTGQPSPGGAVTVTARVADVILDGATVTVDGETVGTTDDDGQLTVDLPERTGTVAIGVERGPLSGSERVRIPELEMTVDTGVLPAMALGTASVEVTLDGEPAAGVPITVDGQTATATGPDGAAEITFPLGSEVTIRALGNDQTASTSFSGLLIPLVVLVGVGLTLFGGVAGALFKLGYTPSRLTALARALAGVSAHLATVAAVTIATRGDELFARGLGRLGDAFLGVWAVVTGEKDGSEVTAWIRRGPARLRDWQRRLVARLRSSRGTTPTGDHVTVQHAWGRFLDHLSVESPGLRTPGELATHAVQEDGLPEQPVRTLVESFREVEYGARPERDRRERVRAAIRRIERESGDEPGVGGDD